MAEITVNPFGTGGELPTNIGIVNDLTTGGADKALSAEQGKLLGNAAKTGMYMADGEDGPADVDITFEDGDIVSGVRITAGVGGIGNINTDNTRATITIIYYTGEGEAPSGTEKLDLLKFKSFTVPTGYYGSPTFAKATTQNAQAVYPTGWQTGTYTITDGNRTTVAEYPYMVWNFGKGSEKNQTIGSADLDALIAGFKMTLEGEVVEPVFTQHKALSIVDGEGDEVFAMSSPSATEGGETEIYSKDAVDALLGADIPSSRIIRVATWNIGHLSYGASSSGGYSGDTAVSKQKAWRKAVNGFAANILCCQEYEPNFGTLNSESVTTADAVMGGIYGDNSIGGKNNYQCQAIFSKSALANGQDVYYDLSGNAGGTYRYQKAETTINGKTVTIISCHFPILNGDWSSSVQRACMNEVIAACANLDYAIVCMDSNFETTDRFDNFISAGFKLANHGDFGDIKTWPTDGVKANYASLADWWPTKALDCIAVKGFKVSNVQIYSDGDLTDHCAIIADLTMV